MAHEPEQHRRRLVRADATGDAHDALDYGRLPDASDVDRSLEALVDVRCVEQDGHAGLFGEMNKKESSY